MTEYSQPYLLKNAAISMVLSERDMFKMGQRRQQPQIVLLHKA